MIDKLEGVKEKYHMLIESLQDPELAKDRQKFQQANKEIAELSEIVNKYDEYLEVEKQIVEAKEILEHEDDEELMELARHEIEEGENQKEVLSEELKMLLIPKDPNEGKNVIMEIRAGTGGDEASIFAGDLFRMYTRFIERNKWKIEIMNSNPSESGGFKEVIFEVKGKSVYGTLRFESGVHRVQRVPVTESSGRIHTSAATVAVLPEAEDIDIDIDENDLRIDVFRSSGHGGQSVNTTDSAVRITHLPTGLIVTCQDEKSQLQNKIKSMKVLRSRLLKIEEEKRMKERSEQRKSMVSTGDRSAKIRTYNYPQSRVTDHRINLTLYKLDAIMDGDLNETIEALKLHENMELLKNLSV